MQVLDDGGCFVCGRDNPIGLHAEFVIDRAARTATTEVAIDSRYQGWQGIVHGGIISALLDEISAQACLGCGMTVVTSELAIRYRAPLPTGAVVRVSGTIVGERRRLVDVQARAEVAGVLVAEATAVMYRYQDSPVSDR